MNRTAQSGMVAGCILGSAAFGVPGAISGMLLGGLLGWWASRSVAGGREQSYEELATETNRLRAMLGWKIKQRLKGATGSERIELFGCADEDSQGHSGMAINEHGETYSWWEHLGPLDVDRAEVAEVNLDDPEYQEARVRVGLP